ncbi:protein-associating with the carboxyl-terminal domain of ezrin [Phthorimaea operculella]|nr:protein-associating with the carboxyl-terminal domain of ezrin [Phthorimaea operculella]
MGNEGSHLNGLEIEEKATDVSDFWSHYQATIKDSCRYFSLKCDGSVSVFKGKVVPGPLWAISTPLEKFSNNLLKYRHPCIIRYISAWQQRSVFHLATEFVQPLSHVLSSQTPLQICIGLNNILRALVFLHEQAGMSHNNVSVAAIYVTGDGQWKLGGLEYLCPFTELTPGFLKQARIHRYDKAVDPNEESYENFTKVDQYGFAVLMEDVFKGRKDDDVPHINEFKKYCREFLQHTDPKNRPHLAEVLQHNFFNHEFISIYKFLYFLPLKSEEERIEFFANILDSLRCYDEETVAKQFSGLLLSRLTMLDPTARKDVIPFILKPKNERCQNPEYQGFFSISIYKEHVKPRLMQLFAVRDTQIRMLLLTHFSKFIHMFSHEELSQHILPELLLGIKDTDDNLVASTLICLSELVPILGADTVIGGKRSKLFTDGRPNPKTHPLIPNNSSKNDNGYLPKKTLREFHCSETIYNHNERESSSFDKTMSLNERPSPVGGESTEEKDIILENSRNKLIDSEEDWSDWENSSQAIVPAATTTFVETLETDDLNVEQNLIEISDSISNVRENVNAKEQALSRTKLLENAAIKAKKNIVDISELDIKSQKFDNAKKSGDEFDFFADMQPIIEKSTVVSLAPEDINQDVSSKLNFVQSEDIDENEGWGENWND